ncbi:unnamed protein product [Caenorhabditis bovis]|uniref:Amidase domain-containing protein n=1 Tax=Caenorhabditis bovis TaxID=2654633 RepID=A0A8S1EPB5_9PELO|nr:unnamed protein product [Caenorhabditis bovis]
MAPYWVKKRLEEDCAGPAPTDPLLLLSATKIIQKLKNREITSSQLIESYIQRIEQVNPIINAVVVKVFDDARKQAKEVDEFIAESSDEQIAQKFEAQPLYGVPFTIKDSMEVTGHVVTSGSFCRKDVKCDRTAEAVQRVQNAGGILLAITNVPELCMWYESNNTVYGRSKNPYDTRRMTGGSSGGEGALIGAAGSVVGIGSDIGGSIRIPSLMNGIFGLKPTPGIVPLEGHIPYVTRYKSEMGRIGPMCRYAEDLELMMKVLAAESAEKLNFKEPVIRNQIRIYYMEEIQNVHLMQSVSYEMRHAIKKSVAALERKYDVIATKIDLPLTRHIMDFLAVSMHQDSTDPPLTKMMLCVNGTKGHVNCYTELIKEEAIRKRDRLVRQVRELLGDNGVLVCPAWPSTAMFHNEPILTMFNLCYSALWNCVAVPVIQCPTGFDSNGLPIGVQVVGNRYSERNLIAIAEDLEEEFKGWTPPNPLRHRRQLIYRNIVQNPILGGPSILGWGQIPHVLSPMAMPSFALLGK